MPEPRYIGLQKQLLGAGVSPRSVSRMLEELADHHADLCSAACERGLSERQAQAWADETLGSDSVIAEAALRQPELQHWLKYWPRLRSCLHAFSHALSLSPSPLLFVITQGAAIARWGLSASLGTAATLGMLLAMQTVLTS